MDYQSEYNQMMRGGEGNQQRFKYLIVAVVAFVLGFGSAWISFKSQGDRVAVEDNNTDGVETTANISIPISSEGGENQEPQESVTVGDVVLRVDPQAPGKSVFVKEVSAPRAVWVIIVENIDGVHGNILGAGLFDIGETAGVVELLRGTVEGGSYYALLHNEDSELTQNRTFDSEQDTPLIDSENRIIEVLFTTSSAPGEE